MLKLPEFRNEPYLDFTQPQNRHAMQQAMEKVRGELGREYDLLIAGGHVIDPANEIDGVRNVAIRGGRVARVAA